MPDSSVLDVKLNSNTRGSVYFAADVIATISGLALTEIDGIATIVR